MPRLENEWLWAMVRVPLFTINHKPENCPTPVGPSVAEGKKDVTTRNFAERLTQGHRPEVIRSVLTAGGYDDRFPQSAFAGCRRPYRRTLRAFRRR
jgi:hypothetical protein